jgi:hypothetical protein
MTIITASYALGTFVSSQITKHKKIAVLLGLILNGTGYLFIGPDPITGLNHHLYLTLGS